ncbi:MAG: ABC transporter substrate-binding protein [Lachnospiraceae bacterium]|nr:ABC transporter substrate-binding protein [Lachnospiraceae bacterium]
MTKHNLSLTKYILIILCLLVFSAGCSSRQETIEADRDVKEDDLIVVGFSQVGSESYWRNVNTESMQSVFTKENGYRLIFENAQQKQTNQITAIRSFIQREVDYIVLAPVVETGWDTVLSEAKEAGIPVIIVDRQVNVSDDSLFTCWVGSDFELEGSLVCMWMSKYFNMHNIPASSIHIADIQGTLGSSAQIGRTQGFKHMSGLYGWDVVAYEEGEFTKSKGKEAMSKILAANKDVNVVYCENDSEALGAIEVLEAAGKKCGSNITKGEVMLVAFDGINEEARARVADGKISCIGECNPMHGPRVESIIRKLEAGETPEKYQYVTEGIFSNTSDIPSVMISGQERTVTVITKKDL